MIVGGLIIFKVAFSHTKNNVIILGQLYELVTNISWFSYDRCVLQNIRVIIKYTVC